MSDTRRQNVGWSVCNEADGDRITWEGAKLAVLMDIRDELQKLNRLLGCSNFTDIPRILRRTEQNTRKRKKRPVKLVRRSA